MKTCSITGCNNPVWGKGLCQKHSPRTPLKKSCPLPKPKTGIDKIVEDAFDDAFDYLKKRNNFFMSIWAFRTHVCQICGAYLGREPRSYMFDHILEKSKYPELEREPDNILLVCLECHDKKSRGIINDKYREKINFAITKFNVS